MIESRSESLPEPSPYYHKPPMRFKNFEIYYNLDYSLKQVAPSRHNYYEFYFLISGDVDYYVDGRQYHLLAGDIILISPGQRHYATISASPEKPYKRYVLWLDPAYLEDLSSSRSNLAAIFQKSYINSAQIRTPQEAQKMLHALLESILINSNSQKYGSDLLTNALVIELLVNLAQFKLFSQNAESEAVSVSSPQKDTDTFIFNVLNYINIHILENISLNDICSYFYVSRSYLSKIFKEEIGMSLHQYIVKKKLFLARQELYEGCSLQAIVDKYSFGNYSTFYRSFKSEFGQSPRDCKSQAQQ